jgi:hypothetical protein
MNKSQVQWFPSIISATMGAMGRKIMVQGQPRQKCKTLPEK